MNLLEIKYGNNIYTCENKLRDIQIEMKLDGDFITINECYWDLKEGTRTLESKRRRKMILKSRIIEITEL